MDSAFRTKFMLPPFMAWGDVEDDTDVVKQPVAPKRDVKKVHIKPNSSIKQDDGCQFICNGKMCETPTMFKFCSVHLKELKK